MELSTLFDMLRQFAAGLAPGDAPSELSLRLSSGREIRLPVPPESGSARHGPDFRTLTVAGVEYTFTPSQAAVVRRLWEAHQDGTPDVGQETLLEACGSESSRLRDVFKDCTAWGKVILPGATRGLYRLAL